MEPCRIFHTGDAQQENDNRLEPLGNFTWEKEMRHDADEEERRKKPQRSEFDNFVQDGQRYDGRAAEQPGECMCRGGLPQGSAQDIFQKGDQDQERARKEVGDDEAPKVYAQFFFQGSCLVEVSRNKEEGGHVEGKEEMFYTVRKVSVSGNDEQYQEPLEDVEGLVSCLFLNAHCHKYSKNA